MATKLITQIGRGVDPLVALRNILRATASTLKALCEAEHAILVASLRGHTVPLDCLFIGLLDAVPVEAANGTACA